MSNSRKKPSMMPPVACDGVLWGSCGALGWALRRASEAEVRAAQAEDRAAEAERLLRTFSQENLLSSLVEVAQAAVDPVTLRPRRDPPPGNRLHGALGDGHIGVYPTGGGFKPPPPQLTGCPQCGGDASTTRGLRKDEIERGQRVCSRCFSRYES
jgi:hypothetical protein